MKFIQTFRINQPNVVFEVFNDETVIINLESGTYYSLDQSGAEVWQLLQQGANCPEIVARIAATYVLNSKEIEDPVEKFLAELVQEKLIVPNGIGAHSQPPASNMVMISPSPNAQRRFTPPSLNKYTDMQDLLLLDPIHDVAEAGWPYAKSQ
ncbi:MAG: PqqD family protein [Caldilineaceae bacterium]